MNGPHISLFGRLTQDPQLRYTDNQGTPFVNVGVACNTYRGPDQDAIVHFFDATLWRGQAENVSNNCQKGDPVFVQGLYEMHEYTRRDGSKGISHQIRVKEFRNLNAGRRNAGPGQEQEQEQQEQEQQQVPETERETDSTLTDQMAEAGDPALDPFG